MNRKGVMEHHRETKKNVILKWEDEVEMIKVIPEEVSCVSFVGNGNSYYLETANTLDKLKDQLKQWESLRPEVMDYSPWYGDLQVNFVLSNGYILRTYCAELEKALEYFSGGNCIVETVPSKEVQLKCIRNKE